MCVHRDRSVGKYRISQMTRTVRGIPRQTAREPGGSKKPGRLRDPGTRRCAPDRHVAGISKHCARLPLASALRAVQVLTQLVPAELNQIRRHPPRKTSHNKPNQTKLALLLCRPLPTIRQERYLLVTAHNFVAKLIKAFHHTVLNMHVDDQRCSSIFVA